MLFDSPWLTGYALFLSVVLGACLGSFLNCAAYRFVNHESVLRGRSHCVHCKHTLRFSDLIPVFSYLALGGRCRYCKEKLAPRYALSELLLGLCFAGLLLRYGLSLHTLCFGILTCILLTVSLIDMDTQLIPDRLILSGILCFIVFALLSPGPPLLNLLYGLRNGLSVSLPLLLLVLLLDRILGRESMGGGDIKLLFMTGLYFDWKVNLLGLVLACVFGLCLSRTRKKAPVPFGPAIALSCYVMMLCGQDVVIWYLRLFGI